MLPSLISTTGSLLSSPPSPLATSSLYLKPFFPFKYFKLLSHWKCSFLFELLIGPAFRFLSGSDRFECQLKCCLNLWFNLELFHDVVFCHSCSKTDFALKIYIVYSTQAKEVFETIIWRNIQKLVLWIPYYLDPDFWKVQCHNSNFIIPESSI